MAEARAEVPVPGDQAIRKITYGGHDEHGERGREALLDQQQHEHNNANR